jgi:hypothetical protein
MDPEIMSGFGDVFMAAANFEDAAIYQLWRRTHAFELDEKFSNSLRFQAHTNGHLITIYYAMDEQWSRKRLEMMPACDDERNIRDRLIHAAGELFSDSPFLWQANKSLHENPFGNNGIHLPNKPHGLNQYADIHDIVFLSALNPPPDHFRFLETMGLSGSDVRRAIYFQAAYQSIMRTSIRDCANDHPKRIIVPDVGLAEYLQSLFPGSKIERLYIGILVIQPKRLGRPRKHRSDRHRKAEQRQVAKENNLRILTDLILEKIPPDASSISWENTEGESRPEKGIIPITNFRTQLPTEKVPSTSTQLPPKHTELLSEDFSDGECAGTIYSGKNSPMPVCYLRWSNEEAFAACLAAAHDRNIPAKEQNPLISPSIFDPIVATGTKRGKANILYVRNIWLDFENGDLKPEEFSALFPRTRMVITNTFHHTAEHPRFRVIIPTSQRLTPEAYERLYDEIAAKLEDAGYSIERRKMKRGNGKLRSGLDWSKRTPTSLFYLPAQAKDSSQSFFHYYNDPEREVLDPIPWIQNGNIALQPELPPWNQTTEQNREVDTAKVEAAIRDWRATPPHHGNDSFFMLGVKLRNAGKNPNEIERILQQEARFGRSPKDRRRQVPGIMKELFGNSISRSEFRAELAQPEIGHHPNPW